MQNAPLPSVWDYIRHLDESERARTRGNDANPITVHEPQGPTVSSPEQLPSVRDYIKRLDEFEGAAEGSSWPQQSQSIDQPQGEPSMLNIVHVHSH
jgi:hypothetical protein